MDRIDRLCAFLDRCDSFADVGCDHGYCTRYMLEKGLCRKAVVSDVSEKCLDKARILLKNYISEGTCLAVCCDGLERVPVCEQVLIAGMGGDEIISILKRGHLPEKFVLQPMRNARSLREFLLGSRAEITRDTVFQSGGKFYTVIKGVAHGRPSAYDEAELVYGKELFSSDVQEFLRYERKKKIEYLKAIPPEAGGKLSEEIELINGVLNRGIS